MKLNSAQLQIVSLDPRITPFAAAQPSEAISASAENEWLLPCERTVKFDVWKHFGFRASRNEKGRKVTDRHKKQYADTTGLKVIHTVVADIVTNQLLFENIAINIVL